MSFTQHPHRRANRAQSLVALAALSTLSACGGGGDAAGTPVNQTSNAEATVIAANATSASDDVATAADASVLVAQSVIDTHGTMHTVNASNISAPAHSAIAAAAETAHASVDCVGGGSATYTVTGGTPSDITNGQFDAGEAYQIEFDQCRSVLGGTSIDGSLSLTVEEASAEGWSLTLAAQSLSTTLPHGSLSLTGALTRSASTGSADGSVTYTGTLASEGITLTTIYRDRESTYALSHVDVARETTWKNGLFQSSTFTGTHTFAVNTPNLNAQYTVSTDGGASYTQGGVPQSGTWNIELPGKAITVDVEQGTATIRVDDGDDGNVDRTFTIPATQLKDEAG